MPPESTIAIVLPESAISPEEIAVAILAELIAVRRGKAIADKTGPSMQWTAPTLREAGTD